ncbi:jg20635 [Pararge aegeria aegeria]|uniref:Jg20635 protein n=1 Tax=Pararge aegeria aegeria TaxID=348720 RepID=A0A8S4RHS0_9NEOP|nr:jg20635 [Pararge aegeria aegeria]
MMEHAAQIKRDEEYPLLKVESGSGDNVMKAQVPSTIPASGWHVTCTSKQFWCSRWPDSPDIKVINNTPVLRTQRSKREILNNHTATVNVKVKLGNHSTNDNVNETSKISVNLTCLSNKMNISKDNNNTSNGKVNDEVINPHEVLQHDLLKIPNVDNFNADNMPHVLLFYDIYGFSDDIGPSYSFPKYYAPADPVSIKKPLVKSATQPMQRNSNYLSLTPEGHFVAASSRHHPFLAQLFSSGCQRVSPQFAIKNTLLNQCSGVRDDIYCENIRLIYNVE